MQRSLAGKLGLATIVVLVIGVGVFSVNLIAHARPDARIPLTGQTVPLIRQATELGGANGEQTLNLSIGLQLRNQLELTGLLNSVYDPRSSLYHHFLTPKQFAAEFAPTADQQQRVIDYLRSEGFTVINVSSNGLLIDANATVAQVEAAFGVTINNYKIGPRTFYANANAPTIPSSLSSLIISIGGMDNSVKLRPLYQLAPSQSATSKGTGQARALQPLAGYGPTDLLGAYDGASLHQGGVTGNGQTVAVFELDGYQQSDITQYLQTNNLGNPSISNVLVDGSTGAAGSGAIEVELDIEVVAAMAPTAAQIVYEGPNSTQGVNDTYNKIVTDDKAQVMTTSWGECEAQSGASELQTLDGIFKQGAAEGIAMFAAAGDSGAYDCNDTTLAVDSPADDPYVTGVGGTNLQTASSAYGSESVWSNPSDTSRSPEGAGGGGGISSTFTQPTWQVGPGVKNQYSNGSREVPDVSADADPATGYNIYCTVAAAGCPSTGNVEVGGTSAAAPLWAGSSALINEYLQKQGKSRMGFANPLFYNLANSTQQYTPFHDITSGTNLYYPATPGYDEASGLGSPDIFNIARDLAAGSGGSPTPTPTVPPTTTPTPSPTNTPVPTPSPTNTPPPTPAPTNTPVPPPPPGGTNLIQNGGFENGVDPWVESSAGGYELIDPTNPHSGSYSAYLCGYSSCNDVISQDFTVPDSVSSITIDYWWYASTTRHSRACPDSMTVQVLDSNGNVIGKIQKVCNNNATNNWQETTFDATNLFANYAGQDVTLIFSASTGASHATTSFFVDDVAVNVQ
jgi:subtilase family serine protease